MINCSNTETTESLYTNGSLEAIADRPAPVKGEEKYFAPLELLEASLASCVAITVRMFAQTHNINLEKVTVDIKIDDSNHADIIAYKKISFEGNLSEKDKNKLLNAAKICKIGKILSKGVSFSEEHEIS